MLSISYTLLRFIYCTETNLNRDYTWSQHGYCTTNCFRRKLSDEFVHSPLHELIYCAIKTKWIGWTVKRGSRQDKVCQYHSFLSGFVLSFKCEADKVVEFSVRIFTKNEKLILIIYRQNIIYVDSSYSSHQFTTDLKVVFKNSLWTLEWIILNDYNKEVQQIFDDYIPQQLFSNINLGRRSLYNLVYSVIVTRCWRAW